MKPDRRTGIRKHVSSVGNSWIVAQSKSHPGLVYYFNTVTREAVWNLSESEIEKARLATQVLESQSGAQPTCPEPKDKPPTQGSEHQFHIPIQNHKGQRFEMNTSREPQHTEGIYSGQNPPDINIMRAQKQPGAFISAIPMSDLSSFDFNALNSHINAFNVISTPNVLNSNAWTIPPQQYIITPTIPFVNSSHAPINIGYNNLLQDNETHASRFTHLNSMQDRRRFIPGKNTFDRGCYGRRRQLPLHTNDLRQQLSFRRIKRAVSLKNNREDTPVFEAGVKKPTAHVSSYIADISETVSTQHEKVDHDSAGTQAEASKLNLDLTALKCLAVHDSLENWNIIVDLNVLLEEFNFLSDLINSDEHCTLLVPENVSSELKEYIARSNNIPARLVFHSLSKGIEDGRISLGQQPDQDYDNSITNPILKTCFGLLEKNVHVILLTNDSELLRYKKFIKVNMFTVDEVKKLLKYPIHQHRPNLNTPLLTKNLIKNNIPRKRIPVSATVTRESIGTASVVDKQTLRDAVIRDTTDVENVSESEFCRPKNNPSVQSTKPLKYKIDAAIQTDTIAELNDKISEQVMDGWSLNENQPTQDLNNLANKDVSNVRVKRREIKLKRSISNQTVQSNAQMSEKKPFRWRRKRHSFSLQDSGTPTNFSRDPPGDLNVTSVDKNTITNNAKIGIHDRLDEISNNENTESSSNLDQVDKSRESSVICLSVRKENITVEETSTSGVISNTDSNVDSESVKDKHDQHHESNCNKYIMHIDSENMEESLKTKCEEWISRFIQIMEEVLAVVLHKEPAFANSALPPPWTLHEAAQCIRKYTDVPAVKHASDKLSRNLFNLSDITGKISPNITPSQYMEMYNDGVSLLKEIKAITTRQEDIETAEESLQKLLIDIKNPQYGSNYSEIDSQEKIDEPDALNESIGSNQSQRDKRSRHEVQKEVEFKLKSPPKISEKESSPKPSPVKIIRNLDIKSSFFSSLNLQRVPGVSPDINETNQLCDKAEDGQRTHITFSSGNTNDETEKSLIHSSNSKSTQHIVRNFTVCAEFEKKLRNKFDDNACDDHDQNFDCEDYEYNSSEYGSDEFDISDDRNDPNVTQLSETSIIGTSENIVASSPKSIDSSLHIKSNNTFKIMMQMFLQEIRNAISEVKVLCDKCYAELKNPKLPSLQRNELKYLIENSRSYVFDLCISLKSMLDRGPNAATDNIQNALKKAGIDISQIDENLLLEYWNTIAICKKQADVFLFSIQEIITAFKSLND